MKKTKFLKFSVDNTLLDPNRKIGKFKSFNNKVIIVNGFNGSGKTLFSPIVSSMDGVEQLVFPYEIEWMSSLLYGNEISEHAYAEFVKIYLDHLTYNQMMSRAVNFRPKDLSSVFRYRKPSIYLRRLFSGGDSSVVPMVKELKPVLSLTTCHLMPFYPQLADILGERLLFIETIRDPLFMFHQLLILKKSVIDNLPEKDFTFSVLNQGLRSTYLDFYSSNDVLERNSVVSAEESVIEYLERMQNFYLGLSADLNKDAASTLIIIPFERFVLNPDNWINQILKFSGSSKSADLKAEMKRQHIPRNLLTDGRNLAIYKRFGWSDSASKSKNLKDERELYMSNIRGLLNNEGLFNRLMVISQRYSEWVKKELVHFN
jgi:hypothetical protein